VSKANPRAGRVTETETGTTGQAADARLAFLDEVGEHGRGWLLAYIAGRAPEVFDDAARTMASVQAAATASLAEASADSTGLPEPEAEL
jgi:hypothetical protein